MKRMTVIELGAVVPVGDVVINLVYGDYRGKIGAVCLLDGVLAERVELADSAGGALRFKGAGAAIDLVIKTLQVESGDYEVVIQSGDYLLRDLPMDIVKNAEARKKVLTAARVKNLANKAALVVQLAALVSWGVRTTAQAALQTELTARGVCLDGELVSIDAQIVAVDDLLGL